MADLERQLRRRSARGQLDPAALLVDVNAAIDSRPQPIRRSRLAPAGALLGVLALLLLVIFGPRLLPTLQVGRSPTPPPAGALSVLSADVFGRLLAEGRLSGRTVLVEGRIGDSGYRGLAAECFPASPCVIGELEGTGALVYSHGHAAPGPLTVLTPAEPFVIVDWQWPQPPIEGTLVFYVDVRNAEYVGHVRAAADGLTWSASEAADVDRAGLAPDEVLLVDGWLTGASIPCAPENELTARDMDHPSVVIELPSRRGCMGSWLTDAPVSLIPDQFERPAGGLQVQDGAWWEFAPEPPVDSNDVGPRRAVYMVGERVFGAGCPEQSSPCRDWVVAARLGGPPPPLEPTAPDPLVVLTPVQFAAQLAAGELDGRTIRVDGRIVEPADGVSCVPFTTCSLGLLEDTSVEVFVEPLPTTEERASIALPNRGRQDTWRWWMQPTEADLRGRLVLHVEKLTRRVDYLGVTRATDESEIWQPSAMRPLDVEAVDQAHVVLVDGWLWAPRRDEPVVCTLVGFPEGLPDGQCPHPVWLTDSRPSDEELAGPWQAHLDPRPDGITLAGDPLYLVGGEQRAQPVHGRFAVAPRLWGCLGDSGLCWRWQVIGVLAVHDRPLQPADVPTPQLASPSPTPVGVHIGCPSPRAFDRVDWQVSITDETGLIDSCQLAVPADTDPLVPAVSNPDGELDLLHLSWTGSSCSTHAWLSFARAGEENTLTIIETQPEDAACFAVLARHALRIGLRQPLDAGTIAVGGPSASGGRPCGGYTLIEPNGYVVRCTPDVEMGVSLAGASNPGGDEGQLLLTWYGSSCARSTVISLMPVMTAVDDSGNRPIPFGVLVREQLDGPDCVSAPVGRNVLLELGNARIPADAVVVEHIRNFSTPAATPRPAGSPAWWELAPSERPTSESTRLELLVAERACASGRSPEGRINEPSVSYTATAITIEITVEPLPGGQDCQGAPAAPLTVQLDEPLGERQLIDGGFAPITRVVEHGPDFLRVTSEDPGSAAGARFRHLIGDACIASAMYDRADIDPAFYEEVARGVTSGLIQDGLGYVGAWPDAVRAFGALEAFAGRNEGWHFITRYDDQPWVSATGPRVGALIVTDLLAVPISGGRTVWLPAYWSYEFETACP